MKTVNQIPPLSSLYESHNLLSVGLEMFPKSIGGLRENYEKKTKKQYLGFTPDVKCIYNDSLDSEQKQQGLLL